MAKMDLVGAMSMIRLATGEAIAEHECNGDAELLVARIRSLHSIAGRALVGHLEERSEAEAAARAVA